MPSFAQPVSSIASQHDPFFVQSVAVSDQLAHLPRSALFTQLVAGRKVLHVGYADWPITDVRENLHVQLESVCSSLDGVDPHEEAGEAIRPYVSGNLWRTLAEVNDSYEVVLVPEVIEHVGDLASFLGELDDIDFETIVITAPDAYSCMSRHFELDREREPATMVEVVHPDHNCWFTPFTLRNVVSKYSPWKIAEPLYFVNGISLMLVAAKR